MTLHYQDVASLSAADIQQLKSDGVSEGIALDYKEQLPKDTEDEKREFRFDVSSFANAGGGVILYGIREKRGTGGPTAIPDEVIPLTINHDKEALRLEQIIRTHIEPRIPGVQVRFIEVENGHIGVVRIPKSWLGLHLVKHNDSYRFYSRTSNGKHILDVTEIRTGFVAAQEGYERLRRFRYDRLAKIVANEGPFVLEEGPKVVVHVIPLSSIDPTSEFDLTPVQEHTPFPPTLGGHAGWDSQHNYDGFVKVVRLAKHETSNYVQYFRNGVVEEALGRLDLGDNIRLASASFECSCSRSLVNGMAVLKRLGVSPPFLVCLSLLGIRGYTWRVELPGWQEGMVRPFREAELILPEILVSDPNQYPQTVVSG